MTSLTSPIGCAALLLASLAAPAPWAIAADGTAGARPLTLQQVERLVIERNPELIAARARAESARADVDIAGQPPNPTLSVGAATPFRTELNSRLVASGIGARIEQLVERGNKRELRVAAASQARLASEADIDETLRRQRLAAAQALFALKRTEARVAVHADTSDLLQRLADAMALRLKAGDIAPSDLARVNVELLRVRNDLALARGDLRQAQSDLAYLLGLEVEADRLSTNEPWPALSRTAAADPSARVEERPDVRAARARLAAAERTVDLARALRTRDVTLSAGVDRAMPESGPSFPSIAISVPLLLRHQFQGEERRALAEVAAAREDLSRTRAVALGEIRRAREALASSAVRAGRYRDELIAQAERSAAAIEFAWRNGAVGLIDLVDARRTLQSTRLDAVDAETDLARAVAAWRAVTEESGADR